MKPTACIRDAERSTAGAWSATATAGAILSATAASACCVREGTAKIQPPNPAKGASALVTVLIGT